MKFFSLYRMPGYVPPHLRGKIAAPTVNTTRRIRFIGNATGNTNAVPNTGARYAPNRVAAPKKKTLKAVRMLSPSSKPVWQPSHALRKAPPKFAKAVLEHLGLKEWREGLKKKRKTKKVKRPHKN
jgi:hypothetical protein